MVVAIGVYRQSASELGDALMRIGARTLDLDLITLARRLGPGRVNLQGIYLAPSV